MAPVLFRSGWSQSLAIPACLLMSCLHVYGQAPDGAVDVNLVLIDAQVIDSVSGQPLSELLRKSDFVLKDEGRVRDISVFEAENVPLDLVLVLDTSGERRIAMVRDPTVGQRVLRPPDPLVDGMMRMFWGLFPQDHVAGCVLFLATAPTIFFDDRPRGLEGRC